MLYEVITGVGCSHVSSVRHDGGVPSLRARRGVRTESQDGVTPALPQLRPARAHRQWNTPGEIETTMLLDSRTSNASHPERTHT